MELLAVLGSVYIQVQPFSKLSSLDSFAPHWKKHEEIPWFWVFCMMIEWTRTLWNFIAIALTWKSPDWQIFQQHSPALFKTSIVPTLQMCPLQLCGYKDLDAHLAAAKCQISRREIFNVGHATTKSKRQDCKYRYVYPFQRQGWFRRAKTRNSSFQNITQFRFGSVT